MYLTPFSSSPPQLAQMMTPALALFYGGFVGERMAISTMMMSFVALSIITIEWSLLTYSLAFSPHTDSSIDPWIGNLWFGAFDSKDSLRSGTSIPEHAMFIFQGAFATVTSAVISGGVVGRVTYSAWSVFIALWHLFVYTPLARWIFYSGGWLAQRGVLDFAGGLVVETNSGVSAFVLAAWISWELHRAGRSPKPLKSVAADTTLSIRVAETAESWSGGAMDRVNRAPHNVPFILIGAGLLFFGWLGFNSGSALTSGYRASRAFANTAIAGAAGMAGMALAETVGKRARGKWGVPSAVGCATGVVVGLVAITPACGFVSQMSSLVIGFITGALAFFVERLLRERLPAVDDTLSVFTGHGLGGMLGIVATGLVASTSQGAPTDGAFFHNGTLLGWQLAGICVTLAVSIAGTSAAWLLTRSLFSLLRIDFLVPIESADTLDISLHGEAAYATPKDGAWTEARIVALIRREAARNGFVPRKESDAAAPGE
jgi:Amt family ammonium transporter